MEDENDTPRRIIVVGGSPALGLLKHLDTLAIVDALLVCPKFELRAYHLEHVCPLMIVEPKLGPNDLRPSLLEMVTEDPRRYKLPKPYDRRRDIKKRRPRRA